MYPKLRFPGFDNNWEQRKLGDVAKYRNGKAHESCIDENGKYVVVNSKFVSTDGSVRKFSNMQNEPLLENEIAFVLSDVPNGRAIARTFLIEESDKYTLNQRIAGITPLEETYPYFLHILMNRHPYFLAFDDGAKQTNLSVEDVMKFETCYPNYMEQRKIGEFFKQLDRLITLHQRKCNELQELKKSMLQKMFPKDDETVPEIRFPGFTDDWEENTLDSVCDMYQPKTISSKEFIEDGKFLVFGANGFIGKYNNYNHETDQVCISCRGANCGSVNYVKSPVWITGNSMVCNIDNNSNIEKIFFYYAVAKSDFSQIITGGAQPQITREKLAKLKITKPLNIMEQQKIGSFFKCLDKQINLQKQLIDEIKEYKKGLLQQMFI